MVTSTLKTYVAGAVAFLLLMLLIPTGIHNIALQSKVKQLETDKTTLTAEALIKRMEVQGLADAIADQNQKITEFENVAKQMADARLKAQQEHAQRVAQLTGQIARLQNDKGASCTVAGIGTTILNEVLP